MAMAMALHPWAVYSFLALLSAYIALDLLWNHTSSSSSSSSFSFFSQSQQQQQQQAGKCAGGDGGDGGAGMSDVAMASSWKTNAEREGGGGGGGLAADMAAAEGGEAAEYDCSTIEGHMDIAEEESEESEEEEQQQKEKNGEAGGEDPWEQMKWTGKAARCRVKGHLIEKLDAELNFRRGYALGMARDVEDKTHLLPWLLGARSDMASKQKKETTTTQKKKKQRRVYIDLGANALSTSITWFMRMYPCDFTEVHAFEADPDLLRIPAAGNPNPNPNPNPNLRIPAAENANPNPNPNLRIPAPGNPNPNPNLRIPAPGNPNPNPNLRIPAPGNPNPNLQIPAAENPNPSPNPNSNPNLQIPAAEDPNPSPNPNLRIPAAGNSNPNPNLRIPAPGNPNPNLQIPAAENPNPSPNPNLRIPAAGNSNPNPNLRIPAAGNPNPNLRIPAAGNPNPNPNPHTDLNPNPNPSHSHRPNPNPSHSHRPNPNPNPLPPWMLSRIRTYNHFVSDFDDPAINAINITRFLKQELRLSPLDTVVVKMDIEGAEWPILRRWILDPDMPSIVDELFVELHYDHPSMRPFHWSRFAPTTRLDALRLLADLRLHGFFAHAWP